LLESGGHTKPSFREQDIATLPADRDSLEDLLVTLGEVIHGKPLRPFCT
jgi:hypothetical protein